jgi:nucleotide-binding universal stress UspA family protein
MRKILAAYDGSKPAQDALEFALDLAKRYGAELYVVAVSRPPDFAEDVEAEAVIENSRRYFGALLDEVKARLAAQSVPGTCEVVVGHPAEQIVLYAERHAVDHVVVGHRGQTMFERWLLGSVARRVIAYAHCAVTVVRK